MQRLEVSGAVRPLWESLGIKGLMLYIDSNRSDPYYKFGPSPPTFGHYSNILSTVQHMFSSSSHHHICTLIYFFFPTHNFLLSCKTFQVFAASYVRASLSCGVSQSVLVVVHRHFGKESRNVGKQTATHAA